MGLSLLARRYPRHRRHVHAVTECRADGYYTLWLKFADGLEGHVYLGDLVGNQHFGALGDGDAFSRVSFDPVTHAVTWESGIQLDPEVLYRDLASRVQSAPH